MHVLLIMVIFRCRVGFRVKKNCLEKIQILTHIFQQGFFTTAIHKVLAVLFHQNLTRDLTVRVHYWCVVWREKSQQTKYYIHIYMYIELYYRYDFICIR